MSSDAPSLTAAEAEREYQVLLGLLRDVRLEDLAGRIGGETSVRNVLRP